MQHINEAGQMDLGEQTPSMVQASQPVIPSSGGELSQEQMIANLQDLAGKIDNKYQEFNSQKFAMGNKLDLKKREALKEVFDIMNSSGIDLSNPEDVKKFLDSLKESNPELYQIVEASLEFLFSDETESAPDIATAEENSQMLPSQTAPINEGQNNMNINTNADINQNQNIS